MRIKFSLSPSNGGLHTVYDRGPIVPCASQFLMSLVVTVYVPQPTVIWLSREPKRQRTDHAVLQCRGQQAGTHYFNRSVTQPDTRTIPMQTENVAVPFGLHLPAHSWLSIC